MISSLPFNKRYRILPLCFICLQLSAQNMPDSVVLRIHYTSQMRFTEEQNYLSPDEKILDIGKHSSHFYSRWAERNVDIADSIFGQGGKLEDYLAAKEKNGFPNSKTPFNVFKNYPIKNVLTYTTRELKDFLYEESMVTTKWEMLMGDTTIAGYPCKKAKTVFRGRTWLVWYAMDIPYYDGPWKLCGLPGLILKADDVKGDFMFNCIGIEKGDFKPIVLRNKKYVKCTPEEMEELERLSLKDPDAFVAKMGYPKMPGFDANGKPLVYKPRIRCLLEYKSEATK
ncbi:GLPGLI family protein [Bacteroidaceae bacterium HV4-6-C5C]|nr:GLPGLI family protein [Bacteroidaceae bacterium HV4-6-C5C]